MIKNGWICSCLGILALTTGCLRMTEPAADNVVLAQDDVEKSRILMEQQKPQEAILLLNQVVERQPRNKEAHYLLGCAAIRRGELDKAIGFYQAALTFDSSYHAAYLALKNIYQNEKSRLRGRLERLAKRKSQEIYKLNGDLKQIESDWLQEQRTHAQLFVSQGKTYLLYYDQATNVTEFPDLDGHLRDMQDVLVSKNKTSAVPAPVKNVPVVSDPLLGTLQETRRAITKKYAHTLFTMGVQQAINSSLYGGVDILKEADDQLSKFFVEEKNTSNVIYLEPDEEVVALSRNVAQHLENYYQKLLEIILANREKFRAMKGWQEVESQDHQLEEIMDSWVQLAVSSLWRQDKLKREVAEEHDKLIPLYQKFLEYLPDSPKAGEYHYLLAKCYLRQGRIAEARDFAQKAQKSLSAYKVRELLDKLEKQNGQDSSDKGQNDE